MKAGVQLSTTQQRWPFKKPFRIAGREMLTVDFVDVSIEDAGFVGRGEGIGAFFNGETVETILADIETVRRELERGAGRLDLQGLLEAGGARNALDCALWDLECKKERRTIWSKLGIEARPLTSVMTIGIDDLAHMAQAAGLARAPILKVKVDGAMAEQQVAAVRAANPGARIIADANQSFTERDFLPTLDRLKDLQVEMLEQPLKMGHDQLLDDLVSPIPLCADESCQTLSDLETVARRYDCINIKLDKTGGLTHALELASSARAMGLNLMVGCMAGTSLSMAPAFVVGQQCDYIDLDGPLLMARDRDVPVQYDGVTVHAPKQELWG